MDREDRDATQGNILIVDDTPANLRLLSQMLAEQGYKVRPVPNGSLALTAAQAATPDLILLDIKMPGIDGYEVCQRLKGDERTSNIPVIFISAMDEVKDKVKAFAAGGVDYVTKPFQIEEVLARVKTHLELQELQNALQDYADHLEELVEQKVQEVERERTKALQAAKLASLGEMATGVAHELNQPLTAILFDADYIKLLSQKIESGDLELDTSELRQLGENLAEDVGRCRRIIDHLRDFGRPSSTKPRPMNINESINGSLTLVGARLREHNVEVLLNLASDLPPILGDVYRLEQVFLNLISNAEYAMHEMAHRVKAGQIDRPGYQKVLEISTSVQDGWVIARVIDNGSGIPKHAQEHIFEPFFTTKAVGEGTGLGLSISHGIVIDFAGEIVCESEVNKGTTFTLKFPPSSGVRADAGKGARVDGNL